MVLTTPSRPSRHPECRRAAAAVAPFRGVAVPRPARAARAAVRVQAAAATASVDELNAQFGEPDSAEGGPCTAQALKAGQAVTSAGWVSLSGWNKNDLGYPPVMARCPALRGPHLLPPAAGKAGAVTVKEGRGGLPTVVLQSSSGATAEVRALPCALQPALGSQLLGVAAKSGEPHGPVGGHS